MIRNDPDDAGLLGAAHLLPAWMLKGHTVILGGRHGGHQLSRRGRALNQEKDRSSAKPKVVKSELWRHGDEETERDAQRTA